MRHFFSLMMQLTWCNLPLFFYYLLLAWESIKFKILKPKIYRTIKILQKFPAEQFWVVFCLYILTICLKLLLTPPFDTRFFFANILLTLIFSKTNFYCISFIKTRLIIKINIFLSKELQLWPLTSMLLMLQFYLFFEEKMFHLLE